MMADVIPLFDGPENTNEIKLYLHCFQCQKNSPDSISPVDFSNLSVGWTDRGLQVWCERHRANVIHIDFERQQHPANNTRKRNDGKSPS